MKIGVLCEYSGVVRDAFIARGHDAVSCDLLDTEAPGPHIKGDCLTQDWAGFDLLICHPPCTRLCNSGVRWLAERDLWGEMDEACRFFNALGNLPCDKIVRENPIPHRYAVEKIGRYSQIVQPWQHGHAETKATCLWLKGVEALKPTDIVEGPRRGRVHLESPGPDRWKRRSTTYTGIAEAMAEQWGG